jgi:NAD(P)-dependent dehydrogenase (short-subunit alcohol dehydrogenase family)
MERIGKKNFLVVGGTRGIGLAFVQDLLKLGHRVSIVGRSPPSPRLLKNGSVRFFPCDLLDPKDVQTFLKLFRGSHRKLNHIVFFQRYRGPKEGNWEGELSVSLRATSQIIEGVKTLLQKNRDSSVVVVASNAASLIAPEQPLSYHVAKAGICQLVRYYAFHLGHRGIRVNSVSPNAVLKDARRYEGEKAKWQALKKASPLGRVGNIGDVVSAVRFLCGPEASYITGHDLVVDGGSSLSTPGGRR